MAKGKDYVRLIHSRRWLRLRRAVLEAHPVCQDCLAAGRLSPATEVHHVRPVEDAPTRAGKEERMYDPSNLRALCRPCHRAAHVRMGQGGKAGAQRRAKAQAEEAIGRFFGEGGGFFKKGEGVG